MENDSDHPSPNFNDEEMRARDSSLIWGGGEGGDTNLSFYFV